MFQLSAGMVSSLYSVTLNDDIHVHVPPNFSQASSWNSVLVVGCCSSLILRYCCNSGNILEYFIKEK